MEYKSQYGQDKLLDELFKKMKNGVFVDIGAHDGVRISNSYIFEKYRSWKGLCVEPLPEIFDQLKKNRDCYCENYAIMNKEGSCEFLQVLGEPDQLSGVLDKFTDRGLRVIHDEIKRVGGSTKVIEVKTIELNKLLSKYGLNEINFMSIDVEGSELEVLKSIDFNNVFIDVLLIENNDTEYTKKNILPYISKYGYDKVVYLPCDILCVHYRSKFYF